MVKNEKLYDAKKYRDIREMLNDAVKNYSDNKAFIIKNKSGKGEKYTNITYKMFQEDVNCLGTALMELGLYGKRIAIISQNRYEWAVAYLATLCGVGIVVPLDKSLPDLEIESLLERSKADAVVFEQKYTDAMNKIKAKGKNNVKQYICMDIEEDSEYISFKHLIRRGKELIENGDKRYFETEINNEEMRIILFTSGTTSISKAVMLSHKNIVENIYALTCVEKIYDTDVSLAFLPLHHTFGSTGLLFFLSRGVANAFCDGLRHIASNLKEYQITIFVCVPLLLEAMYKKINNEIENQGKTKAVKIGRIISNFLLKFGIDIRRKIFKQIIDQLGGKLRFVISGAAAIDKEVAKGFNELGIRAVQGYGLTETSPVLIAENDKYVRYGSVGLPLVNVEIEIDNPNEKGIGEIKAKGPNVMLGYYENEEATKEVLKNGWFYTGDLGYKDKDGFIYVTGRKKNVIVLKNGKNIYPEELEILINNLQYVAESMVFGMPKGDDLLLSAKIVYSKEYIDEKYPNISREELEEKIWKDIKEINKTMPNYKHIKKIIVTDEPMIKTTTQKVKRYQEIEKILKEV